MPKVKNQVLSRPPLDRMNKIHGMLKRKEFPNCPRLAREREISVRTLKRDVDFMKYRLGLPIEYDSRRYGYFYSRPVDFFPAVTITESELFAVMVANKAIAQYRGTELQKPLENAFQKLTNQLDQNLPLTLSSLDHGLSFRPFAPGDADLATFRVLTEALKGGWVVAFDYRNLGTRKILKRKVQPHHLACIDNHWYLFAFDLHRQAMRTFVLTRITGAKLTRQTFVRRKDFNAEEYLKGSFQVFKGGSDYEVVVDFDAWATDLLRGRKWHASQELTELRDGASQLRFRLNNLEEISGWVLGWGVHASVVRPKELRERLRKTAEILTSRYQAPAEASCPTGGGTEEFHPFQSRRQRQTWSSR